MGFLLRMGLGLAALAVVSVGLAAAADEAEEIAQAEALALARYHEGFPPEYGAQIGDAGAAHLAELLEDAEYAKHHATLIEALAASDWPGAYPALAAYDARDRGEQIHASTLRALRALRVAMGRVARRDNRALAWLLEDASRHGPASFRAGPHDPDALGARLRRQSLFGLGLSDRPAARAHLRGARAAADPATARAARTALGLGASR